MNKQNIFFNIDHDTLKINININNNIYDGYLTNTNHLNLINYIQNCLNYHYYFYKSQKLYLINVNNANQHFEYYLTFDFTNNNNNLLLNLYNINQEYILSINFINKNPLNNQNIPNNDFNELSFLFQNNLSITN